jgi:hypothetical protein
VSIPNPGSDAAHRIGCKCPRMDNGYGRGWMGGVNDEQGEPIFVYNLDCPLHKSQEVARA